MCFNLFFQTIFQLIDDDIKIFDFIFLHSCHALHSISSTSFIKMLVYEVGLQAHLQKFWFGENPGKICGNLDKMCEKLRKIALCALILQKWHLKCRRFLEVMFFSSTWRKILAKMLFEVLWFEKMRPKWNAAVVYFLEVVLFGVFFGQVWTEILRNLKNLPVPTPLLLGSRHVSLSDL